MLLSPCCIPTAHSSSLAASTHRDTGDTQRDSGSQAGRERLLALSEMGETLFLGHPNPTPQTQGGGTETQGEQLEQCRPSGVSHEGRGRKEREGHGWGSPTEQILLLMQGPRVRQDQSSFSPDPTLSVSSCILSWNTEPALPCRVSSGSLCLRFSRAAVQNSCKDPGTCTGVGRLCCLCVTTHSSRDEQENRGETCPGQVVWDRELDFRALLG